MPGFWVEISESNVTKYLLEAPDAEAAKEIAEDLPMEDVKKLAIDKEVLRTNWEISDVTEDVPK